MENSCDVVDNALASDIIVSEFELQLHYYIHFRTGMTSPLFHSNELDNTITFLLQRELWH